MNMEQEKFPYPSKEDEQGDESDSVMELAPNEIAFINKAKEELIDSMSEENRINEAFSRRLDEFMTSDAGKEIVDAHIQNLRFLVEGDVIDTRAVEELRLKMVEELKEHPELEKQTGPSFEATEGDTVGKLPKPVDKNVIRRAISR